MWTSLLRQSPTRNVHFIQHISKANQARFLTTPARYRVVEHTVDCSHTRQYLASTANGDHDIPKLAVKQYIPHDNTNPRPGDVTIVGAHANGFPKVHERLTCKNSKNNPLILTLTRNSTNHCGMKCSKVQSRKISEYDRYGLPMCGIKANQVSLTRIFLATIVSSTPCCSNYSDQ